MVGWILLATFLLLLIYLLTAPIWLEIDTEKECFRVRFHRLLVVSMSLRGEAIQMDVSFLGFRTKLHTASAGEMLVKTIPARKEQQLPKEKKQKPVPLKKIIAVLRTFHIKELVLHFDTGNQPLNGILYPLAASIRNRTKHVVHISFTGKNKLVLRVRNNLLRMLWAYLRA